MPILHNHHKENYDKSGGGNYLFVKLKTPTKNSLDQNTSLRGIHLMNHIVR